MTLLFPSRIVKDRNVLKIIITLAVLYTVLSFAYSFVGFIHIEAGSHYHEYSPSKLAVEIFGHFAFGFVAAVPLVDLDLALLAGSLAVLIDVDHILSAANFDVSGRPDHSILYILISTAFLVYFARRLGVSKAIRIKLAFVGTITVLSHIAYDVFAAGGSTFQIMIPFSFDTFFFGEYSWILFELGALLVSALGFLASRREVKSAESQTKINVSSSLDSTH